MREAAEESGNGLYVPSGALWGGEDIRKMADRGSLKVKILHSFHLTLPDQRFISDK